MKFRVHCKKHDAAVEGTPFCYGDYGPASNHPDIPEWHIDTSDMSCPAFDEIMQQAPKSSAVMGVYRDDEYYTYLDENACVADWEIVFVKGDGDREVT